MQGYAYQGEDVFHDGEIIHEDCWRLQISKDFVVCA